VQQGNMQLQLTPEQQQAQQLAAKERERADDSRFASNLVYSRASEQLIEQQRNQVTSGFVHSCPLLIKFVVKPAPESYVWDF
jgi:hypothetical protein